jgi:signal transduction histidine kinase
MSEGFRGVFRGIRPVDGVLAGALTALGVWLMVENVSFSDEHAAAAIAEGSLVHQLTSHSWFMVPVFALAALPLLWWRRSVLAVTGVALGVVVLHDLLFGWVTRCGAGLPLAFVLAYLGAVALERSRAWIALGLSSLLTAAVLVHDATTGFEPVVLALPIVGIVFGVGRAVRHRTALSKELQVRTTQLQQLRDERVALEVASDRARLSHQLDELLQERLGQLALVADSGKDLDPAGGKSLFESIENDSRETLDGMREIVGLLRGGDVALAPVPSVAHLDALLARHTVAQSRLTVTGDPRALPATVELSAYRIVEHLVTVLAEQQSSSREDAHPENAHIDVAVFFSDNALEIRIRGPVDRSADLKAAVGRAKERARFLGGSLDVTVRRGRATAVALLPVLG